MSDAFLGRRASRRMLLRGVGLGSMGLLGAAVLGCDDDDDAPDDAMAADSAMAEDDDTTPAPTPTEAAMVSPTAMAMEATDADLGPAREYALVRGWYRGEEARYYDFGMQTPLTSGSSIAVAPIYAFATGVADDGTPQLVVGQHNIIDVIPGDAGYSDLWEVNLVMVGEDYEPDSIRSKQELDAAGLEMMQPGLFVNCPVVPAGSTLEGGEPLTQGWYRGERVYYPDFGMNPPVAIPIWAFATGVNEDGSPAFVEGQQHIIDAVPGDEGYSAFWRVQLVMVPDDYEPNSITSAGGVMDAGLDVMPTDLVVNCPVVSAAV